MNSFSPGSASLSSPSAVSEAAYDETKGPSRNKSAYNYFFSHVRRTIIGNADVGGKPHRVIGFSALAKTIAARWKSLDEGERRYYEDLAAQDKERYVREKKVLKKRQRARQREEARQAATNGVEQREAEDPRPPQVASSPDYSTDSSDRDFSDSIQLERLQAMCVNQGFLQVVRANMGLELLPQPPASAPDIASLAQELDDESVDYFVRTFRPHSSRRKTLSTQVHAYLC